MEIQKKKRIFNKHLQCPFHMFLDQNAAITMKPMAVLAFKVEQTFLYQNADEQ